MMNRALPEMLHCLNTPANLAGGCTDMSVLERQRARMKWQQQEQLIQNQHLLQQQYFGGGGVGGGGNEFGAVLSMANQVQQLQGLINCEMGLGEFLNRPVKADPGLDNHWPEFGQFGGDDQGLGPGGYGIGSGYDMNYGISRTISCPPAVAAAIGDAAAAVAETRQRQSVSPEKLSSSDSFKKRKAEKNQNPKAVAAEEQSKEKRNKASAEEGESKITDQNSTKDSKKSNKGETSAGSSKENNSSKVTDQKTDYIHVRARRGQATDSHSLAERVRREKISERMKYLQDLVPGCNKITGKAGMLDEIINYVQSLQRQVEFLSMKLATVNPTLDFNIDNLFAKEAFPACTSNFPVGGSSEVANPAYLQFNQLQQVISNTGLEMGIDSPCPALRRTISSPVPHTETFLDLSCFNQIQSASPWDANLQNLYGAMEFHQGRSPSFPAQQFTGSNDGSNLKMEM